MTLVYFDPNGLIRDIPVEKFAICVSNNVIFDIQFLDFSIVICHYLRYEVYLNILNTFSYL